MHESWVGGKFQGYKHDLILWYNRLGKFLLWQRNQFSSFPTQLHHFSWRVHIYCDHTNLQTVHICCQVIISFFRWFTHTVKWHHFRDGSCLLSSDHIILQMVHTYCQVMTSFLRLFTPIVKWSYHSSDGSHILSSDDIIFEIVHTYWQVIISFFRWFTHTVKWRHHFWDGSHLLSSDHIILHHHSSKLTANNLA